MMCRSLLQCFLSIRTNPPDVLAMIGASAALHLSQIPFKGPTAAVAVGLVDGEFVINPTLAQAEKSTLHLVVAGTADAVMMVEAGAQEVPEMVILCHHAGA